MNTVNQFILTIYTFKKGNYLKMTNATVDTTPPPEFFTSDYLISNIGTPFGIGLAVGYFVKKLFLFGLILFGAAIILLFLSEHYGISTINYDHLQKSTEPFTNSALEFKNFLLVHLSKIPSKGISATTGFFVGLKLG